MRKAVKLGQNLLINKEIAKKIVSLIPKTATDILEIGPGRGILTEIIIENFPKASISAVEIDPSLYSWLRLKFQNSIRLFHENILSMKLRNLFSGKALFLIGNLPYYISKEIIDLIILQVEQISSAVLMLQKDFIDKLLGMQNKTNAQSIMLKTLYDIDLRFLVSPGSFYPSPKVISSVISLKKKEINLPWPKEEFYSFLKACYHQPRKTLLNNMASFISIDSFPMIFDSLSIPLNSRPSDLPPQKYFQLFFKIKESPPN